MILKNGLVVDENFTLKRLDLRIEGSTITQIGDNLDGDECVDMSGKYILPGFIDTHIHGAYGVRISDKNPDLNQVTTFEATQGVTSIAITTAASEFSHILKQIEIAGAAAKTCTGTKIAGIHLEGPFISKKYKGAMNPEYILDPDIAKFDQMLDKASGLIKIMTVAPENIGSEKLIKYAVEKGITISMGHTNATYDESMSAIKAGASQATHTFNAMRALNHREPGVIGAALTEDSVKCEMICDYVHLHPATVKMIYKIKGADKINMISDSGHAAGMNVTEFEADGLMRYVKDGVVRLADGTIAGSAKTMADGVKNLITDGIPIEDVAKMASFNPAKSLKLENTIGSIAVGKTADLAILDENYNVVSTYIDGKAVYSR